MENKTDLRIVKTRLALHNALTELLEQKNFENITVNELCDVAMIRRATFYKYFSDKYDYFIFYISEIAKVSRNSISTDVLISNPLEYTERRLYDYLNFMRSHKKLINNIKNSNLLFFFYQNIQQLFEEELREILIRLNKYSPSPEIDFTITLYAGGLISAAGWWIEHPDALTDKELAQLLLDTISSSKILNKL